MLVNCRERSARAGSGMERRKWVRNVAFATRAIVGRWRRQQRGCTVREVGREAKSSPDTSDDDGCQGRGKGAGAAGPKHEQTEMSNGGGKQRTLSIAAVNTRVETNGSRR